ncbi:hypothetical protein B9Z55_004476 [Caenorhabditis nigoni]|uniref:Uncharacterized protein n=1 Tax=Caenorhabditis nigoni TaxID=1611254 RepID=A0A2G5UWP9_9PELO|nr:hypothetical protein B9Z55_004476 [Caenorhabditis nigoni]
MQKSKQIPELESQTQERSTSSSAHNNQKLIDKSIGAVKKTGITTKDGAYSLVETPNETSHSSSRDVSGPESSGTNVIQIPVRAGITAEQEQLLYEQMAKIDINLWKTRRASEGPARMEQGTAPPRRKSAPQKGVYETATKGTGWVFDKKGKKE